MGIPGHWASAVNTTLPMIHRLHCRIIVGELGTRTQLQLNPMAMTTTRHHVCANRTFPFFSYPTSTSPDDLIERTMRGARQIEAGTWQWTTEYGSRNQDFYHPTRNKRLETCASVTRYQLINVYESHNLKDYDLPPSLEGPR